MKMDGAWVEKTIDEMSDNFAYTHGIMIKRVADERGYEFDRVRVNKALLTKIRSHSEWMAFIREQRRICEKKGHDDRVRSQAAWDAGYDEPVVCVRCGRVEM